MNGIHEAFNKDSAGSENSGWIGVTSELLHQLVEESARRWPDATALRHGERSLSYEALWEQVQQFAAGIGGLDIDRHDRVAIYLEKRPENIVAMFGAAAVGAVFVPVNPILRARQVAHILRDCNVRILVTGESRLAMLGDVLAECPDLRAIVLVGNDNRSERSDGVSVVGWAELMAGQTSGVGPWRTIDTDMAAIFYTSGSTGKPKGVVLSHRNLVAGAASVSQYLGNNPDDRILSILPLGFDAGFSQLTTAFYVGAQVLLLNYLSAVDVVRACETETVTGITGVPPLWIQLARVDWPVEATRSIRYFANTGGHMPRAILDRLRAIMPAAKPYLMYGLTEAFRSTYLDPAEIDRRPDSIGKAIPNAEVLVLRPDGEPCGPGEAGELVHRGALVSLGYWNDPQRTVQRFRPVPRRPEGLTSTEMAVFSGDIVKMDDEGFLYFVSRKDDMIKTSGYRVSPNEIEEVIYDSGLVREVAALGIADRDLGQAIVVLVVGPADGDLDSDAVLKHCRRELPPYMVPKRIIERASLPRTPSGKMDRKQMAAQLPELFVESGT